MSTITPRPYRTPEWPSEIVWTTVHENPELPVEKLVHMVWGALGLHDATTPVYDLLSLAVWAVASGAPADLVSFADEVEA